MWYHIDEVFGVPGCGRGSGMGGLEEARKCNAIMFDSSVMVCGE